MTTETRGLDLEALSEELVRAVIGMPRIKLHPDIARKVHGILVERLTALGAAPGEPCAWMVEDGAPEVFRYEDVARAHAACTGGRVVPPYRRAEAAVPDAEGRK